MAEGIFIGNKDIIGVYIGNKSVVGVYVGGKQIWPNETWSVESVTIELVREEIIEIAPASGGPASTKVFFKAIEHLKSSKGNKRDIDTEQEIIVEYAFGENTVEEERTETASANYVDVLGNNHAVNGSVKQAKLEWQLVDYFVDYGDATPVTYASYKGGTATSSLAVSVFARYISNTGKSDQKLMHEDTVTLSYDFGENTGNSIKEHTVITTYTYGSYGSFEVSGKVYQSAMSDITILPVTIPDIAASGGGYSNIDVEYVYEGTTYTTNVIFLAVTAGRIPAEERDRMLIDTRTITVEHGNASASTTLSFYQEANKLVRIDEEIKDEATETYESTLSDFEGSLSYPTIAAGGGTVSPNISWSCKESLTTHRTGRTYYDKYIFTSGASYVGDTLHGGRTTDTSSTNTLSTSSHYGYDLSFVYEGDDTDENSGKVTAQSLGTSATSKDQTFTDVDVTVKLKGNNGRGSGQGYGSSYVYQAANTYKEETTDTFSSLSIVDANGSPVGTLTSAAQTVFAQCKHTVKTVRTYASGSTQNLSDITDYITSDVSMSTYAAWYTPMDYVYSSHANGFEVSVSENTYGYERSSTLRVTYNGTTKSISITQGK